MERRKKGQTGFNKYFHPPLDQLPLPRAGGGNERNYLVVLFEELVNGVREEHMVVYLRDSSSLLGSKTSDSYQSEGEGYDVELYNSVLV